MLIILNSNFKIFVSHVQHPLVLAKEDEGDRAAETLKHL